jgi:hypothetical protein
MKKVAIAAIIPKIKRCKKENPLALNNFIDFGV